MQATIHSDPEVSAKVDHTNYLKHKGLCIRLITIHPKPEVSVAVTLHISHKLGGQCIVMITQFTQTRKL